MDFPFVVVPELNDRHVERFRRHIDSAESGWYRRFTESIWRRHQHPSNARKSGWTPDTDKKRRIVHFYDEYDLAGRAFVLKNTYVMLSLTLPGEHIDEYEHAIAKGMKEGNWHREPDADECEVRSHGDLTVTFARWDHHPQDARRGRARPEGFRSLDITLRTRNYVLPAGWGDRPWRVFFDVGLRKVLPAGRPTFIEPEQIADFLPAQLELGCGPSIEAGIPHLSTLHKIYGVSHADYTFVFRAADDGLIDVFRDPAKKYREMTDIYRACMTAGSTPFYDAVLDLWQRGFLVGPVITNNFDCQCADLGLPEMSLRRYDWEPYYPTVEHDSRARSLLVVGVHADRRLVQMRARERGLRVVIVDPEAYIAPDGTRIPYAVEAPQDDDLFVRETAQNAFTRLHEALRGKAI